MAKRLNMFILIMLVVSQTILGPLVSTSAVFAEGTEQTNEQKIDNDEEKTEEVNKEKLKKLLEDVEKLKADDYTEESFEALEKAVEEAEEIAGNDEVTQDDVDNALEAVEEAEKGLEDAVEEVSKGETEEKSSEENEDEDGTEPEEKNNKTPQNKPMAADVKPLAEEEYEEEITLTDEDHVSEFSFKVRGEEFVEGTTKVSNGDPFELKIDFKTISNELDYGPGTKLKYELPESFLDNFSNLQVPGTFGGVGTMKIDGGFVVITLGEGVMIGDTVSDITEGHFTIEGIFSEDNDDWEKEVSLPQGEKFTVNFVPKSGNGETIKKENGKPNKDGQKSNVIDWKVTVNTNLANTADNPVFKDELSASATGHKYDTDSVEIREIDVRPNGNTAVGDIAQGISPQFNQDNTEMTINLEAGKAYEITYKTIPDNPGTNEDVTYNNSANYDGTNDSGSTSVHFGKAIEKNVSQPGANLITNWTIKYNGNEQLIEAGTTMSDSWTTNLPQGSTQEAKQDLVNGANGVLIDGLNQSDYEVTYDFDEQKFEIEFKKDFNHPIEIKYSTKPVDGLKGSENFTVVNEAKHGQIETSDRETARYNQTALTLNKTNVGGLDYNTKTMKWRITANQAGYSLNAGATFEDTFTNKNMVLDDNADFVVKIDGTPLDQTEYELTNNDTEGFSVKLNEATDKEVVIEYTTSFDQIKNVDENRSQNYHNTVELTESGLPTNPKDSANINSNLQQKANGSKSGTYNYETKEFEWEIIFNYNSNTLDEAVLKDKLPEEHGITEVTLEKGSINPGGTFIADADQAGVTQPDILGENEFSHTLGQIDQPYRLVYKTKMKDDVLPVDGNNNYSVKNKAELLDGDTPNAEWERTVTVNHSNKVLDQKNGKQVGSTETIEWNFLYNTAQSKLENVKITDTFGLDNGTPNQLIDESSLKVYKVTYTSDGSMTKKGEELEAGEDYDVSFNTADGATFVLEFENLNYGIYVEYESVFIGIEDSPISNELAVTYNDGEDQVGSSDVPNLNFTYGAFASTSAGEFVIIKTDEATGEPMEGVGFTLKNRNNRALISGTTDENGVLDFEMPFATGTYSLEEITQEGYEPLNNFTFQLTADGGEFDGKQIVNVTNIKTTDKDNMCPDFTITVKDVEGKEEVNKSVKLVNEETGQVFEETTDEDGKIVKDRKDLPAGNYKVYEVDGNDEIYINDIEVKYVGEDNTECNAEVRPEVTSISGTKTWKDGGLDNDDRPGITIELLADGEETDKTVTLNGVNASDDDDNVWEYQFENLRKLNNTGDKDIVYTVKELAVDGYKSEQDGTNFVNIRTSDVTIEIPVEKVWEGPKVETEPVTINLLADGEKEADLVLSKDNEWKEAFKDLAIYNDEGEEIEYTVEEVEVEGYNTETTGDATDGFTVTNTQKTYAIGDYVWVDYNSDGTQNESEKAALEGVTVELYDTEGNKLAGTETDENGLYIFDELVAGEYKVKFTLTPEQAKKYKFTKQDQGNATEDSDADEDGWTTVIELNDDNDHLTQDYDAQEVKATEGIDPTWDAGVIELTEVTVNKTWVDDNDATEDRPESIEVNLKQNGTVIETETIKEGDDWTHTFTGLTKYSKEDEEYEYTVSEFDVPGYEANFDQDNFEITNTRTDEKSITINKAWLDNDDATGGRPDKIEVELFRSVEDGDEEFVDTYPVKAEDDWVLTIEKLPAFDEDGKAYTYEIEEIEVDGYETSYNGFDITNLRVGETEVSVEKVWKGSEEDFATINLLADKKVVDSIELSEENGWKHEFTELPEFDEEGKVIEYEVKEVEIAEYHSEITGDAEEGFTVTNTQKTYAIGDYTWIDRNKDGVQDENEKPLKGVIVELYDKDENFIRETTTNDEGLYIFDELPAGDYKVKFKLTEEQEKQYRFTTQNAGDDTNIDSDADEKGWTTEITLNEKDNKQLTKDYEDQEFKASEGIDPTWDAGVIELTDVSGEKAWVNDHNESEALPKSITVNLLANGAEVGSQEVTAEDDWTYSFQGLDKYDETGEKITYSVTEDAVDGYETSYDGNNITNTKICEKFTVEVEDEKGKPVTEEEYTFESEDGEKITKKTDKDGKITFDREDLPEGKYTVKDKDGNKVGEIDVKYNVDCEDNVTKVIVPVEKPEDPKTCEEIEITVKEDGKPSKEKEYTFTSADGKTKVTFTTDKDGKVTIDRDKLPNGKYTVTDKDGNVVGTVEITDSCEVELNIKPTKDTTEPTQPEEKEDGTTPSKPSEEDKGSTGGFLPKTATNTFNLLLAGALLLVAGTGFIVFRRRKAE